jgi:hypothetical protein
MPKGITSSTPRVPCEKARHERDRGWGLREEYLKRTWEERWRRIWEGVRFRRICEDSVRESLRVDLFGLADVNASRKEFTGAAGGGHVVFVLTLELGFSFQMFVVLLLVFLF